MDHQVEVAVGRGESSLETAAAVAGTNFSVAGKVDRLYHGFVTFVGLTAYGLSVNQSHFGTETNSRHQIVLCTGKGAQSQAYFCAIVSGQRTLGSRTTVSSG